MRFALTEDQLLFRDAVHDLLTDRATPEALREAWEGDGNVGDLWSRLVDMGVAAMRAPEAAGGMAFSDIDLVAIQEAAGYAAVPEPLIDHAAVGVPALADAGSDWLAGAVSGELRIAAALGTDVYLPAGQASDLLLVEHDGQLAGVLTAEATLTPQPSVDEARKLVSIDLTAAAPVVLGDAALLARSIDRGALAAASQLVGVSQRLLDVTGEYAKERQQFGKPIGVNQAVKHQLADVAVAIEFARPLVLRAAASLAEDHPEASAHVSMAKAQASDAADLTARTALQMHGAIGYTYEYDLHLWLKRAWSLSTSWGSAAHHRNQVGIALGI